MENIIKKNLPNVTLIGVTCIDLDKLKIAADICEKHFSFGAVKILTSIKDSDSRIIPITHYTSLRGYNDFCIKELEKYIETTHAICFHPDGFILNPSAWTDDFLQYDYIGSPWHRPGSPEVGNGGFSLRSKRLLKYIAQNYKQIGGVTFPEDQWICETARPFLEKEGMKFAPVGVASKWGKEGNARGVVWNGEFGWHGLNYTDISKWFNKNPEYIKLIPQKFTEFTEFMRKYPVYDGTFHVMYCKPIQLENYVSLANNTKKYDCRLDLDLASFDEIHVGHKIIYSLFRISVSQVGIPTFERKIERIEKFSSKKELLKTHPEIEITPSFYLPKWKQKFIKLFGNLLFQNNKSYTVFFFE